MKRTKLLTTEERNKRREQIAEEIGEDILVKVQKALTVLAAAMLKRAQYQAKAQLQAEE
jgi:hypothetical protein